MAGRNKLREWLIVAAVGLFVSLAGMVVWGLGRMVIGSVRGFDGGGNLERYQRLCLSEDPGDQALVAGMRQEYDALFEGVLARNPGMAPVWRQVPDERNGFLQWLEFCERHRTGPKVDSESFGLPDWVVAMISGKSTWQSATLAGEIERIAGTVDELTRIGELTEQSSAGICVDRYAQFPSRFALLAADLLLADARLSIERRDSQRAWRRIRAAMGLAEHFHRVETPSLLMKTVVVVIRSKARNCVFDCILPAIGRTQLSAWRSVVYRAPERPVELARVLKGEAYVSLRGMMIPMIAPNRGIDDREALLDACASGYLQASSKVVSSSLAAIRSEKDGFAFFPPAPEGLSMVAREGYNQIPEGFPTWAEGWIRMVCLSARDDAAFAVLLGNPMPPEPLTDRSFVFDRSSGMLRLPDDPRLDGIQIESMKLR